MTDLRRKVGHEKGKSWTALLNEIVDQIVELQMSHTPSKEIYATLQTSRGTRLGCLVVSLFKTCRTSDGTHFEGWENEKMCSNSRHGCGAGSSTTDKPGSNQRPSEVPASTPQGTSLGTPLNAKQVVEKLLSEVDPYWKVDGPWTMDDVLNYISCRHAEAPS